MPARTNARRFPAPRAELHARIRSALRNRVATERLEDASQVIFALANAVEAKDAYTRVTPSASGRWRRGGPPRRARRRDVARRCAGRRAPRHREDSGSPNEIINKRAG